jgi:DegV family protein with EDD domain
MGSLSGTINAATTAARSFPEAEIHVVDSGSVAGGLALMALHAGEMAHAGAGAASIVAALERDGAALRGFATVPDLSHAVRTGRVSRAQAFIGSLVKIVPVLRIDGGQVREHARVRTYARALDTMVESAALEVNKADGARICIIHSNAAGEAASLATKLRERMTTVPAVFEQLEAGPVIGTHAGQGAVGLFVIPGV